MIGQSSCPWLFSPPPKRKRISSEVTLRAPIAMSSRRSTSRSSPNRSLKLGRIGCASTNGRRRSLTDLGRGELSMKKPLRALIVEDSEPDAELLLLELRRQGYE